jgi:SAM-dependent methyltransferase
MDISQQHQTQARYEDTEMARTIPSCYSAPDSVDYWRHKRMYDLVAPLIATDTGTWLTIGDGRYGSDAYVLRSLMHDLSRDGSARVTASSISTSTLEVAKERGWIEECLLLNAEEMNLEDDSFDYVFCKETFHHLPRPLVGLYEMLRVARRAVILIEPTDGGRRALDRLKRLAKRMLRGDASAEFEPAGNFIYRVSISEAFKIAAALQLPFMAYRTFNDAFVRQLAGAPASGSLGRALTGSIIALQDLLVGLRLMSPGLVSLVLFKSLPSPERRRALATSGYRVVKVPINPYTSAAKDS